MHRKIIKTADGSTTICIEDKNECYHSVHGAIQEAYHVFIHNGLALFTGKNREIAVLEMGFGTGLNALITSLNAVEHRLNVYYEGVEGYPVSQEELEQLNYIDLLKTGKDSFALIHQSSWEATHRINPYFTLKKRKQFFSDVCDDARFDLVYFDAFGARVQPELWQESMFAKMHTALKPGGKLVTYAAKGAVRRTMQKVGFAVERLPGPPGKREMLRASK